MIIYGAECAGKVAREQMIAKTMNGLQPPEGGLPDFCGVCANCQRIAQADAFEARCAEAVEARERLRETDKNQTRIFIKTHPDVLVIPPHPPQLILKTSSDPLLTDTLQPHHHNNIDT